MKNVYIALFSMLFFTACQDELYDNPQVLFKNSQAAYMGSTEVQKFLAEGDESTINELKVKLVNKENKKNLVSLEFGNEEQLKIYNEKNQTNYELLPKDMYEVENSVLIRPNTTIAEIPIRLKNFKFPLGGVSYALPVKLNSDNIDIVGGQESGIIIINQKNITKALRIRGYGTEDAHMFADDFKVDRWTMEVMVNRSAYNSNNKSIAGTKLFSFDPKDEIYTRFGDVTIKTNQLQIKTGASQIDVKNSFKEDKWYMLAFVYDGKNTLVYINGVLAAEQQIREGKYGLTGFWIGGSNELIREFRFWKTARSANQIKSNIWTTVDPNSDDLLVYYPMNGKKLERSLGEVKIIEDESKVWDWSKNEKNLNMPTNANFVNNKDGKGFVFPPERQ